MDSNHHEASLYFFQDLMEIIQDLRIIEMRLQRLKSYNSIVNLLMSGRPIELKNFLARASDFNYNSLYKTLSSWVSLGLVIKEEVRNKVLGGSKVRYKISQRGRECFQEISYKMPADESIPLSKKVGERILEKMEQEIKQDASEIIEMGMSTLSGARLQEYFLNELIELFQDRIYDIFSEYDIIPNESVMNYLQ